MEKLACAAEIRLGRILRNLQQGRNFSHTCPHPVVQTESGLVDLR